MTPRERWLLGVIKAASKDFPLKISEVAMLNAVTRQSVNRLAVSLFQAGLVDRVRLPSRRGRPEYGYFATAKGRIKETWPDPLTSGNL